MIEISNGKKLSLENDLISGFTLIKFVKESNQILALNLIDSIYYMSLCDQCDENKLIHQ